MECFVRITLCIICYILVVTSKQIEIINNNKNIRENTLLHIESKNGDENNVRTLIKNGADVHAFDTEGFKPIHLASKRGHVQVASCLLDNGAGMETRDIHAFTPLHHAAFAGQYEMSKYLMSNGANIEAITEFGYTPLHLASFSGHIGLVDEYVSNMGANVEAVGYEGGTALYLAWFGGHADVANYLLKHGANVANSNIGDGDVSSSPLHLACKNNEPNVVAFLVNRGDDLNVVDIEGYTPLHRAVDVGNIEIVTFLIDRYV